MPGGTRKIVGMVLAAGPMKIISSATYSTIVSETDPAILIPALRTLIFAENPSVKI